MDEYSIKSDETLVELSLLGNSRAYEELVKRHERAVKRSARSVTRDEFSAEDASQDAFVSAWVNLPSLRDPSNFRSWVCSIAKNRAKKIYLSSLQDNTAVSLSQFEDTDSEYADLTVSDDERQTYADLREAVERLGEKIREAVRLFYFDDLSVAEIASKLSVPEGTVKRRLFEGRQKLRKGFGAMENENSVNGSMAGIVMRQVESLKMFRMKNDRSGFEKEYGEILEKAENLRDSEEKSRIISDILMMCFWWLPEYNNDEVLERIRHNAEVSRNEDIMMDVLAKEHNKVDGPERIQLIKEQISHVRELGMTKTLGYLYFWLGHSLLEERQEDDALECYNKVLEILRPTDVYYANAMSAIKAEKKRMSLGLAVNDGQLSYSATGEEYRYVDGKLYFWSQPGYEGGEWYDNISSDLFYFASRCDNTIYDPDLKAGDVITASDRAITLKCISTDETVETPAGIFEKCILYRIDFNGKLIGGTFVETAICPGVGIVCEKIGFRGTYVWKLRNYVILGGDGVIPFAPGNRWEYGIETGDMVVRAENSYEVTGYQNRSATVSACSFKRLIGYNRDTWTGNMLEASQKYWFEDENGDSHLTDVRDCFCRAAKLADTKREKIHTAIAGDVMERILMTDPELNPAYTQKGHWNFFSWYDVVTGNGMIRLPECDRSLSFEWKDMRNRGKNEDGWKIFYNGMYDILQDAAGRVWDEKWAPGYTEVRDLLYYDDKAHLDLRVLDDETVDTPSGTFDGCRHIAIVLDGLYPGWGYRGGHMEYWFAPSVGIVKFRRPVSSDNDNIWILTKYSGTGKGYFPVDDGLFRRYEPTSAGDGWHGSAEYTFDRDETGTVVFHNALGTQDRYNYEAYLKE